MIDLIYVVTMLVAFIIGVAILWFIFIIVCEIMMKLFEKTRLYKWLEKN